MGKNLSSTMSSTISRTFGKVITNGPTITDNNTWSMADSMANGTAAEQSDLAYHNVETIADSATRTFDMTSEADNFADTITFVRITCMCFHHKDSAASNVDIGNATNAMINWVGNTSDIVILRPGASFILWSPTDGYAVTATTADEIDLTAGATGTDVEVLILGTSA